MSVSAGIVVTGTEVLGGQVADRNGPWLADALARLGVELRHVTICGDRRGDLEAQLRFLSDQRCDLIVTSGGLGPTADDLTLEVVAAFMRVELALDETLERRIGEIVGRLSARWPDVNQDALDIATRKQALVPAGATVLEPAGTAPGILLTGTPSVLVLPGPPSELTAMWPAAIDSEPMRTLLAGAERYEQSTLRLYGIPESEIAATLRVAEREIDGFGELEITTCLRRGEVEVVVRAPKAEGASKQLTRLIELRHGRTLFSTDGSTIDDQIAMLLGGRRIALAESCTAGLLAARLSERPGSSGYLVGGAVVYSNEAKTAQLGVDPALIAAHGAVSEQVARAMAQGALERLGADTAVAITGIAGPGGGSAEKPVGTVYWSALLGDGSELTRTAVVPGDRAAIRDRATTVSMHMLRTLLGGSR